ncbi:ribonuclease P protein component, partial [Longivirga aurantiaca]
TAPSSRPGQSPRAGFVVSKAVGGSVVRHAVARKLRHLMAPRLGDLPVGSSVVVRALPDSARATSVELAVDLDGALASALRKASLRSETAAAGAAP